MEDNMKDTISKVFFNYQPDDKPQGWCDNRVYCDDLIADTYTVKVDYHDNYFRDIIESVIPLPTVDADRIRRSIRRVIFNDPATIVFWKDGSKTVAKCGKNDVFDKEKGLMACIIKHLTGDTGRWNEILKKWVVYDEPVSTVSKDDETVSWSDETTIEEDETPVFEDAEDFFEDEDIEYADNLDSVMDDDVDDEPITEEDEEDDADEDS
jgi:hypothetical protein